MVSVSLGTRVIHGTRKSIENLCGVFDDICVQWGIKVGNVTAVVTDNGANIAGAARQYFGQQKHFVCVAHNLNLVATKTIGIHSDPKSSDAVLYGTLCYMVVRE